MIWTLFKKECRMLWKSLTFLVSYILGQLVTCFFSARWERSPLNQSLSQSRKEAMA